MKRFLRVWGRDIALAGIGGALGLLVVFLVSDERTQQPLPTPATQGRDVAPRHAEKPQMARRVPAESAPRKASPATPTTAPERPVAALPLPRWEKFAARPPAVAGRPMIAVIIDDMGLDRKRSARAIALPASVTLSFLTYAIDLRGQTDDAHRHGHELLVHVPMEPDSANEHPGPKVLATDQSPDEVRRRLDWDLGRFDGYVGINNHMGSRFTADPAGMSVVLEEIKRRGLLFIDSRTTTKTVARGLAGRLGVPFAERNVFLDDDPTVASVMRQLGELEHLAAKKGYAVAIGHPKDATLEALERWLPGLAARGFALVPVSAIVRHRLEAG